MGTRNLDRIALYELRHKGETVADMWKLCWRCIAVCEACGIELRVDLVALIRLSGPGLSLWNKTAKCRRVGCDGRVYFMASPPGGRGFEFMGKAARIPRSSTGPFAGGKGRYIEPQDIEPPAVTAARGPVPPDPE